MTQSDTYSINPKQAEVITNDFGEFWSLLPDPYLIDGAKGITHAFKIAYGEKGDVLVMTNEPALRFFDGNQFGYNIADGAVQMTEINLLDAPVILSYSSNNGIHLWGYTDGRHS
jgi:hypothetical protein